MMRTLRRFMCLMALLPCNFQGWAQSITNEGTEFWFAFPECRDLFNATYQVNISSRTAAAGTVTIPGTGFSQNFNVQPGQIARIVLPVNDAVITASEQLLARGVRVTSNVPIVVYANTYHSARSEASLILPNSALGDEYIITSYPTQTTHGFMPSEFIVVAAGQTATVEITTTAPTQGGQQPGVPWTVTLNPGQVYLVKSQSDDGDMTGSIVRGTDPDAVFAVFNGHVWCWTVCISSRDPLFETAYPTKSWGRDHILIPSVGRTMDKLRVVAREDNTVIRINGGVVATLNRGQFHEAVFSAATVVSGSRPVAVAHYQVSQGCDNGPVGDPSIVLISANEQMFLDTVTFFTIREFAIDSNYVNIVTRTNDVTTMYFNNQPINNWTVLGQDPIYSYTRFRVDTGAHTLTTDGCGFLAYIYGMGQAESYFYAAGVRLNDLNDSLSFVNITTGSEFFCAEDSILFSPNVTSENPISFLWDFGDGNTSTEEEPLHAYAVPGMYLVQLITEYQCFVDTVRYDIDIRPIPEPAFTVGDVCHGDSSLLINNTAIDGATIASWTWTMGDGFFSTLENPAHLYGDSGTYDIKLVAVTEHGCLDSVYGTARVHPLPVAAFSASQACLGHTTLFTDGTQSSDAVNAHQWTLSDGISYAVQNPQHDFQDFGEFTVQLLVTTVHGCLDSTEIDVTVNAAPIAAFTNDTVCAMLPTSFTDTSAVDTGVVVGWLWDFGDGGTSTQQHPTHVYLTGGTYSVQLTVTTDEGCQDSITRSVVVHPKPVADFTFTDECLGFPTLLNGTSTVAGNSQVVVFSWEMGDNAGTSAAQDTAYIYDDSGIFTITLEVETDLGCRDTVSHDAEVFVLPVAAFSVQDVCGYDEAIFINSSTIPSGSIDNNLWNLGDGTLLDTITPAPHLYATHGTYDIRLITISDHGCRDTADAELTVFPVPMALFTFDTVCFPEMTSFTDLSTVPGNGIIDSWFWRFGDDGINTTDQHPVHPYGQWGDYEVTLTVTTADGCVDDTLIAPARVHPKPLAAFSPTIANCHEDTTFFADLSTLDNFPQDSLVLWQWRFGDGATSPLPSPTHLYDDESFYDATLTVTSNHGCTDSVTHPVEIYPLPRVMFSVNEREGCQPFRVQFYDESNIPLPYQLRSWAWDLGDSTGIVTTQFPTHTYLNDSLGPFDLGIYTVTLTVTSMNGCVSSHTIENLITEHPKPTAHFDVDPKRAELLFARMRITDLSSPNVTAWLYDMGDWATYEIQHPVHNYADTGIFVITQFVTTDFGCRDTAEFTVRVDPEFYFYIPNTFTPNNDGVNDTFFGTGVGVVDYRMVIFDRWGAQVFESGSMDLHWDGTKNGRQVQIGVYTYMIRVVDVKGEPHHYVGNVNVVR